MNYMILFYASYSVQQPTILTESPPCVSFSFLVFTSYLVLPDGKKSGTAKPHGPEPRRRENAKQNTISTFGTFCFEEVRPKVIR